MYYIRVENTSNLSIRVPKKVKEQMKSMEVDWPAYLRAAIEGKIKEAERREASKSIDMIRKRTKPSGFDSTKAIREDRDA